MLSRKLKSQITDKLTSLTRIGESRHQAKRDGDTSGIHSWNTYHTYKREMEHFANWCNDNYQIGSINRMDQFVPAYFDYLINKETPATSLKTKMSALKKFYDNDFEEVQLPSVKRSNITRGRYVTRYAMGYSEERNRDLIEFMRHTGMRRHELQALRGGCVSQHEDGNYYIDGVKGKGGKVRDIRILDNDINVIERINNTPSDKLVWGKVSKHIPIHNYRADYATLLYRSLEADIEQLPQEDVYYCRNDKKGVKYDKNAMYEVSKSLGHERINVIASNYLYVT